MIVIITLLVLSTALFVWGLQDFRDGFMFLGGSVGVVVLIVWGVLTVTNLTCESLGESYGEEVRFDWLTGCMLPLDDGREIQIDEDSIALVIRNLVEDGS